MCTDKSFTMRLEMSKVNRANCHFMLTLIGEMCLYEQEGLTVNRSSVCVCVCGSRGWCLKHTQKHRRVWLRSVITRYINSLSELPFPQKIPFPMIPQRDVLRWRLFGASRGRADAAVQWAWDDFAEEEEENVSLTL